jgi:hypothetical protein
MSSEVALATDWELYCLCWEAVFLRLAGTNYVEHRLTGSGAVWHSIKNVYNMLKLDSSQSVRNSIAS